MTSASAMKRCGKVSQTRYESRLVGENGLKTGVSEGKRNQKTLSFRTVSGGQENPIQTGFSLRWDPAPRLQNNDSILFQISVRTEPAPLRVSEAFGGANDGETNP